MGLVIVPPGAVAEPHIDPNHETVQLLTLANIAPTSIALGLTTHEEIAELTTTLARHVGREDNFVTTARVVQAWGRA